MIGIIGFGRFGKLMATHLSKDYGLIICDPYIDVKKIEPYGKAVSLEEVCAADSIILSIPISSLQELLRKIALYIKPGALIIDVCSVKEKPMEWMLEILPKETQILGTHPMFGPDSAKDSLDGKKIILCNERTPHDRYIKVKDYLSSKGIIIIEATPEKHDKEMATSLALTHFIGRGLSEYGAKPLEIDTEGYK
jgi:prephenate dehydrogenase